MSLQEEAKRVLPLFQLLADGEKLEYQWNASGTGWLEVENLGRLLYSKVRLVARPKYRPYTREEWERVDKVREKSGTIVFAVTGVFREHVHIGGMHSFSFETMLEQFTHLDGRPCGVEVPE